MDVDKIRRANLPAGADPEIDFPQYVLSVREILVRDKMSRRYLDGADILQVARSGLQYALDVDPSIFTIDELESIYEADRFLLSHIDDALRWLFKSSDIEPGEYPKSHWWWYLDLIKSGVMPEPDIDKTFEGYFRRVK